MATGASALVDLDRWFPEFKNLQFQCTFPQLGDADDSWEIEAIEPVGESTTQYGLF